MKSATPLLTIALLVLLLAPGCARVSRSPLKPWASGSITGRIETSGTVADGDDTAGTVAGPVLVYVEAVDPPPRKPWVRRTQHVAIEDGHQQPEIQLLNPSQPLQFRNADSIYHELFTLDTLNPFELRLEGGAESLSIRFDEKGLVKAFCRLHPDESYTLIVSDARHFELIDGDSHFAIPDLRPGEYRVHAASPAGQIDPVLVRIESDETIDLVLRLTAPSFQ